MNVHLLRRILFILGLGFVSFTFFVQSPNLVWYGAAGSAVSFTAMATLTLIDPDTDMSSGLIRGMVVLFLYSICMPNWGRTWYPEGEAEGWRVFILFPVLATNILFPLVRGCMREYSILIHFGKPR